MTQMTPRRNTSGAPQCNPSTFHTAAYGCIRTTVRAARPPRAPRAAHTLSEFPDRRISTSNMAEEFAAYQNRLCEPMSTGAHSRQW